MRVRERADLRAAPVHERLPRQPSPVDRLAVQLGPGIRRGDRDLDRVGVDVAREANRLLDRRRRLARQAEDERAVDLDAELLGLLREPPGTVETDALPHAVKNRLVAGLV